MNCYPVLIRDSRITTISITNTKPCASAKLKWLFRLWFAQSRVTQLDLAPTLAAFVSRSVISKPPRFARDYSARVTLAVFVEAHLLPISDAECDPEASRKPSSGAIRESRIASNPRRKEFVHSS
jgi:hypothetical protein